ncbi:MAG: hypothetical protein JNL21_38735 [Myxococcales bacterium]|nr:hypothetical protein [Myxococcales bacterium]
MLAESGIGQTAKRSYEKAEAERRARWEKVSNTPFWEELGGVFKEGGQSAIDAISDPIATAGAAAESMIDAISHPIDTGAAMAGGARDALSDAMTDIAEGRADRVAGRVVGNLLLGAGAGALAKKAAGGLLSRSGKGRDQSEKGDGATVHKRALPKEELDKLADSKPGSCKTASERAQGVLDEHGIESNVHQHSRYPNLHYHTRLADGTIIDPTYTQFFEGVPAETFIGSASELASHLEDLMSRFPLSRHLPAGIATSGQQLFDRIWGDTVPIVR